MATILNVLSLDVGERRVGVARASMIARLPEVLGTIDRQKVDAIEAIKALCREHVADCLVIGLPRNLSGQDTAQTAVVRSFARDVSEACGVPFVFQDEALTSVKAEAELASRGRHTKGDVDGLAALYILEDWLKAPVFPEEVRA